MTNSQLIEAIRRLLSGAELSGREASEIVALVVQNTKRETAREKFTDCGRLKGSPYEGQD